jgi:HK97 family phage major capsid protein
MSFGDFSRFLIRDVAGAEMLEFQEVRGRQYQTSYVMFSRHDSKALDVYAIGNLDVS